MAPISRRGGDVTRPDHLDSPDQRPDPQEIPHGSRQQPWMKFAGLGMELAGSTLGLAAIGYLVDRYRGKDDGYGIAVGVLVGFAFGMYRLVGKAMQEVRNQSK